MTELPGRLHSAYDAQFIAAGSRYGLSPALLAAVARQESGFDPAVRSGAGATGLMQLMPATAAGLRVDPLDPRASIDAAAAMLAGLRARFGSTRLALGAYNAGPGAVAAYRGLPPYPETRHYVRNVLALEGG